MFIEVSAEEAQHHRSSLSPLSPPPPPPQTPTTIPSPLTATLPSSPTNHHLSIFPNRHHRAITITASIALFWSTVSLIPIYNKYFFQKEYYPYPMATAGIQLLCVSMMLTCVNVGNYYYWLVNYSKKGSSGGGEVEVGYDGDGSFNGGRERAGEESRQELQFFTKATSTTPIVPTISQTDPPPSCIFGPNFLWKLYIIFPVGFLFGLKKAVMNLGLHLIPTPTHLLLQSTDIIWTVLGAWFINGEHTSTLGLICLCGCFVGTVILTVQVGRQHSEDGSSTSFTIFAIGVNLISPMLMGLCVATLRSACVELMEEGGSSRSSRNHRLCGSVGSVELTAIKTAISAIVALSLASIFEGSRKSIEDGLSDGDDEIPVTAGWFHAFRNLSSSVKLDVLGGSLPTLIFQVNCTFLAHLTSTVAVGLVGQLKIIPQWIVAMVFSPNAQFHMTGPNIFGALLTMTSAVVFAINEYIMQYSATTMQYGEEKIELLLSTDATDEQNDARGMNGEMRNASCALIGIDACNTNYGSILR